MSARRPHPKSKSGCTDCKRRRVKCDERRPRCDNCRKRNVLCSYSVFDLTPKLPTTSPSRDVRLGSYIRVFSSRQREPPGSVFGHGLLSDDVRNGLVRQISDSELPRMAKILQYFAETTIPTLTSRAEAQAAWRSALPNLATRYNFVTHGMLATAALHLTCLDPDEEDLETYGTIAAIQLNIGMVHYRSEVQDVTTANAEALFAFSTMVTMFVLRTAGDECRATLDLMTSPASPRTHSSTSISDLTHTVCRIFRSLRGVLVILVPCWEQIQGGLLQSVVRRDWWPQPIPVTLMEIENDEKLRKLEKLWSHPGKSYEYSSDTLRYALKGLREAFALVSRLIDLAHCESASEPTSFDWTSIIHWPVALPLEFLTLLEQRQVEAWVLVAHYAILPGKITDIWWLKGWAVQFIAIAALVIGENNWEWIAWPAAAVGFDLDSLRNDTNTPVCKQIPTAQGT
ncbi:hypothetical protein T440DRAFT_258828 [Plenodomus tracheiphilus IPT5]|uniref:Zn(2)-C6 fungal-type domain-containing protein n=1 Tax=Plenodomus tracheiphilus IPT5 TaxID=1408161 RepID=A0A6A7AU62_9PLEO|nr:hypothetical protein T440DRAFT_258828 [Plenodomus tracheiphilus IPT5]